MTDAPRSLKTLRSTIGDDSEPQTSATLHITARLWMYLYELRWAHFDTLDEYEDMKMCQQLMKTKWVADSHEDLVKQIEEANKHKVKSISYVCSFDKPETPAND